MAADTHFPAFAYRSFLLESIMPDGGVQFRVCRLNSFQEEIAADSAFMNCPICRINDITGTFIRQAFLCVRDFSRALSLLWFTSKRKEGSQFFPTFLHAPLDPFKYPPVNT
ncbi:MAG: hypothetical protein IJQ91_00560, partial [Acidaminococcaceae bacterium]|nr:hypothetical protein [Acidaminococcaceae bacterium]